MALMESKTLYDAKCLRRAMKVYDCLIHCSTCYSVFLCLYVCLVFVKCRVLVLMSVL